MTWGSQNLYPHRSEKGEEPETNLAIIENKLCSALIDLVDRFSMQVSMIRGCPSLGSWSVPIQMPRNPEWSVDRAIAVGRVSCAFDRPPFVALKTKNLPNLPVT